MTLFNFDRLLVFVIRSLRNMGKYLPWYLHCCVVVLDSFNRSMGQLKRY